MALLINTLSNVDAIFLLVNTSPVFEKNTTVCTTVYFTYSTYQKRLSEKNCVLLHNHYHPLPLTIVQWCVN